MLLMRSSKAILESLFIIFLFSHFLRHARSQTFSPAPTTAPTTPSPTLTPVASPSTGTGSGEDYSSIYITIIVLFSILFIIVLMCVIWRFIKKKRSNSNNQHRNGENADANTSHDSNSTPELNDNTSKSQSKSVSDTNDDGFDLDYPRDIKFRAMSGDMTKTHERVPSKTVIISITTPKGSKHVRDPFGNFPEEDDQTETVYAAEDGDGDDNNGHTATTTTATNQRVMILDGIQENEEMAHDDVYGDVDNDQREMDDHYDEYQQQKYSHTYADSTEDTAAAAANTNHSNNGASSPSDGDNEIPQKSAVIRIVASTSDESLGNYPIESENENENENDKETDLASEPYKNETELQSLSNNR